MRHEIFMGLIIWGGGGLFSFVLATLFAVLNFAIKGSSVVIAKGRKSLQDLILVVGARPYIYVPHVKFPIIIIFAFMHLQ